MLGFNAIGTAATGTAPTGTAPTSDTRAPILTGATAAATGSSTAIGSVTTDEATGTLYFLAATAAPSAAAVKAGGFRSITSAGVKSVAATNLPASTQQRLYFLHVDAAGNESDIAESPAFTTPAAALPGTIDATKVPASRNVIFLGNKRVVTFPGNKRTVTFQGNKREVKF